MRFLAWGGYVPQHFQEKFIKAVKEKHGIDLKMEVSAVDSTGDFFNALRYEKADVISPSHTHFKDQRYKMIQYNMLLPLNLENIPNHKNVIPGLQNLDFWTENGKVYGIPLGTGPYSLAYNSEVMEDPKSLLALWDPKYKNRYTLGREEYWANVFITALAMGYDRNEIHDYKKLNTYEFQEKLKQLAENAHHMWVGVERPKDLKGMDMALMWGVALTEKNLAAPWQWSDAKEGMTFWIDLFSISHTLEDKPKLKQIAEEWINFVLSDEYQAHFALIQGGTPITTTVKDVLPEEAVKWYRLDDPDYFNERRILWPVLNKKNQKGLLRLWKKALRRAASAQQSE
ncbi:MAG: extracellular solute-binding protein [Candidatus Thiodiazotropha sp.]